MDAGYSNEPPGSRRARRVATTMRRRYNKELQQLAYNLQLLRGTGRPVVFQLELTNKCPMTCQMCPRTHSMDRSLGHMSRELYTKILDEAALTTSDLFLHHFGDSLLHPELGDFIDEATRRGIRSYLSANPVLLTRERIRAIVDRGLHELVLSLDGVTAETSAAVRGRAASNVRLAEERILELLEHRAQARSEHPRVILQIVRQKQNAHEVDEWLRRWSDVPGIDRLKVKSYVTWSGNEEAINSLRIEPSTSDQSVVCDKPWTSVTVLWDGRVVPCCFDHNGLLTLGDANHDSLLDIWRGEALAKLRQQHRDGDLDGVPLCRNCVDKEGYPVKKWFYPLNRLRQSITPLGDEAN